MFIYFVFSLKLSAKLLFCYLVYLKKQKLYAELATMSCNTIIITILKIFLTKKLKSKC